MDWNSPKDKAWYGCVKSAIQKHIRRGECEGAARMTGELWRLQSAGVKTRLPIIVAEDSLDGAALLPAIEDDPIGVVWEIAARPKNRDGYAIMSAVGSDIPPAPEDWFGIEGKLMSLAKEGKIAEATRMAWGMWNRKQKKEVRAALGGNPVGDIFLDRADKPTVFAGEPVVLIAAAVLYAAGKVKGDATFKARGLRTEPPLLKRSVVWYACDYHTMPGKVALNEMMRATGLDEKTVKTAWFWGESAKLGPMATHEFFNPEGDHNGMTMEQIRKLWAEIRPRTRDKVRWTAETVGIEATGD